MLPFLQPGDLVLADFEAYGDRLPQVNDIVVVQHPQNANLRIIKRVTLVFEQSCFIEGDNRLESTDSRFFGCVPLELVLGCATSHLL